MPASDLEAVIRGGLYNLCEVLLDRRYDELLARPRYGDPKRLNRHEHKVFSQTGEDGIIAEIFRRVGVTNRVFAECAPGDGIENNTLYLLTLGWKGCWIESKLENVVRIAAVCKNKIDDGSLAVQQQSVTAENIESLFDNACLPLEFDLLSIDIDGNDFWVWKAIERFRPRVVVIEYNATFPPACDWVMEYDVGAVWDGTCNFGASLAALTRLATGKGYKLICCCVAGTNAFFVREDLVGDRFLGPFTAEAHYEPPRYYLISRRAGHMRRAVRGVVQPSD
ncbi:MAG: hypothetical protein ACRD3D_05010 [Terriglobia bacterium]